MPLSPLELYQRTLVSEFQREFEFCIDVAAGRAQDRGDFTDKLVSLAQSGLGKAFSNIPIPGASMVQTVISFALDQANAQRKSAKQDAAETLVHETDPRQLQLLLEIVAMEAARRYQWWLTERLVDDPLQGVIPFAKTGVERMLEFLLTGKRPCNESTLLQGLILGNSGGCVSDYVNTSLDVRDEETGRKAKIKKMLHLGNYTAEGAYGRTGLRTGGKQLWALAKEQSLAVKELRKVAKDVKALAKISDDYADAGYTNLKDQSQDPKYGYIDVPDSVRQALHGDVPKTKTQQRLPQLSKKLQAQLNVWQPVWVTIMRADLEQYLAQKTKQPSLLTYCQQNLPNAKKAERVFYVPDSEQDYDLTDLDFSGADCSHAVFNHVQFGQSLANSKWQHSFLRQADFSFVNDASHMNFSNAHAENLIATGVNFSGSNFTQTDLSFANLEGADLSNCQVLGTQWYQANLTDMIL